jgi:fumarate hydratase subunit beta
MSDEYRLRTPIPEKVIRSLTAGDIIYISGTLITARDSAHTRAVKYADEGREIPVDFRGNVLYHCGPLVRKVDDEWEIVSAGPTTSTRMEYIEPRFIELFRPSVIVGKGGMGLGTTEALNKYGAVYAAFPGGVGVLAAGSIKSIIGVEWLDLGVPEALWILEVEDFGPLTVAIDTHKRNLYIDIKDKANIKLKELLTR